MTGELASLVVALLWAIMSIMLKPLTVRLNPVFLNNIRCLASALFSLPLVLAAGGTDLLAQTPLPSLGILIGATIVNMGLAEILFLYGMRHLDLSVSYPISLCGYPLVTLTMAYLFLGEQLSGPAFAGAFVVLAGLYFTAFPKGGLIPKLSLVSRKERLGLGLIVASVIAYSAGTVMMTAGIAGLDLRVANLVRFAVIGIIFIPFTLRHWAGIGSPGSPWRSVGLSALNGALGLGLGGTVFLFALNTSGAALTSVLTSTSPLFLLPMTVVFLKERPTRKLIAGVVISVAGIVLVFLPRLLA